MPSNAYLDTSLLDKAIKFAVDAHSDSERRGKGFPYIVHPMEAVEIVSTMTSDQELLAAAVLHDTVEDTSVTVEQIKKEFGRKIAEMVHSESDVEIPGREEDTWRARKQIAIDRLRRSSYDAKIVALGDKLSNMRAIARDYRVQGDNLWSLFHAPGGRADHKWHYEGLVCAMSDLAGTDAYEEFRSLVEEVFGCPGAVEIDMNDYELSGGGYMSQSYNHRDGRRMVKLYGPELPPDMARREFELNNSIAALGVRTPRALRTIKDGDRYGVEFERIADKKSFARAISDDPSSLEFYAKELAREAKYLHSLPSDGATGKDVKAFFTSIVEKTTVIDGTLKEKALQLVRGIPDSRTCLHGDMHIGNIVTDGYHNYWIDLPDFGYGSPIFDMGMMYMVSYCNNPQTVERVFHMSVESFRQVWAVFAKEYFGQDLDSVNARVAPVAALYLMYFDTLKTMMPEHVLMIKEIFKKYDNKKI